MSEIQTIAEPPLKKRFEIKHLFPWHGPCNA